jgi:hypothetical protein
MESLKKIGGINLLILLLYMGLINVSSTGPERELGVLVFAATAITFHVGINILLAVILFFKKDKNARAFLLSAVIVLVVGFSTCLGSTML